MPRPSIALFLATAGLLAGTAGCGRAPEAGKTAAPSTQQPTPGSGHAVPSHKEGNGHEGGEGDEG
jgi:type IV secretory pathway TrbL component